MRVITWMWFTTTEQRSKTAFRPDVQIEPPEEVPDNSEFITSVDTRKVQSEFAVRNVTELIVDDGQQADRGRKTRLNDVDGLVRGVQSAGRIERLLRNKRGFSELWNQKGECAIPCGKKLCSFPTLSEQESGQTRQMDRGEIEVEEERRVRTKHMPVLPTDSEKHESESTHVASRSQCKTEDSRKHLEIESSLPRVGMDRGFLARSTDADLVMNTMLIQKPHNVVETRQVSHEAPEPHAVKCALENLHANGLGRVLLKGSVGSAAQTFVDPVRVGRGEWMLAEKSSKCLHQSSGAGENVREIEGSAKTNDRVLPGKFGCRANSNGTVPPWVAGCVTHVPHRSEKHQNVRARSRMRKFRDSLTRR